MYKHMYVCMQAQRYSEVSTAVVRLSKLRSGSQQSDANVSALIDNSSHCSGVDLLPYAEHVSNSEPTTPSNAQADPPATPMKMRSRTASEKIKALRYERQEGEGEACSPSKPKTDFDSTIDGRVLQMSKGIDRAIADSCSPQPLSARAAQHTFGIADSSVRDSSDSNCDSDSKCDSNR